MKDIIDNAIYDALDIIYINALNSNSFIFSEWMKYFNINRTKNKYYQKYNIYYLSDDFKYYMKLYNMSSEQLLYTQIHSFILKEFSNYIF
jgi:hypothetical protein